MSTKAKILKIGTVRDVGGRPEICGWIMDGEGVSAGIGYQVFGKMFPGSELVGGYTVDELRKIVAGNEGAAVEARL